MSNSIVSACRQGAKCIYIAVEESVADDISQRFLNAANEIERLTTEVASKDKKIEFLKEQLNQLANFAAFLDGFTADEDSQK